jgi:predicted phosphodiesterase
MKIEKMNDAYKVFLSFNSLREKKEVLMISDLHFDSKKCNRSALKSMLDEAVERKASVMIFGDLLDVMGAKFDPRSGKSDIRPEYNSSNYFQDVVDDCVKFFGPYSKSIIFISKGNHEDSVKRRHEFDLLEILAYKLKMEYGWKGVIGGYEGWIMFDGNMRKDTGETARSIGTPVAYYTHGSGGNAPVTRGVIQTNRRQVQINADIFISGHIHTQWALPIPQRSISARGVEEIKDVLHLQLGCFKESHRGSWEAQKGFGPANIGGYWLKFFAHNKKMRYVEERTTY